MTAPCVPFLALIAIGAGWGISIPLTKITVSVGYLPFGLIFWQVTIGACVTGLLMIGREAANGVRFTRPQLAFCTLIALIGTILPNSASYLAAIHLPGATLSLILSTIPMIAFPIALTLGNDQFSMRKLIGLCLGLVAMVLLGWNGAGIPTGTALAWLFVAFVAPTFYAFEGNLVARIGTFELEPIKILFGASLIGMCISLPLALVSGQFITPLRPFGAPEWALVASSTAHVLVYSGYLWLVGRAGSVFAAQVSYLVTMFGIFWAVVLLGETIPVQLWLALALVMTGLSLVQPRRARQATGATPDGPAL